MLIFLKKKNLNKWRDVPHSWIGRVNIVKMSILPKPMYRLTHFLSKSQKKIFLDVDKIVIKFIWNGKETRTAQTISKKKNAGGGMSLPNFKTDRIATVIKAPWY